MHEFQMVADTPEAKEAARRYIEARRQADTAAEDFANAVVEQDHRYTDMIETCLLAPDEMGMDVSR